MIPGFNLLVALDVEGYKFLRRHGMLLTGRDVIHKSFILLAELESRCWDLRIPDKCQGTFSVPNRLPPLWVWMYAEPLPIHLTNTILQLLSEPYMAH